jgi:phosphatidylserine/phosphatidylglycerophosphate/cardiolipin synthase-like enzyme
MEACKVRISLALAVVALFCPRADARRIESWSYQRLKEAADLIVVATVATTEPWPENAQDASFGRHLEGRLSTFSVQTAFKGADREIKAAKATVLVQAYWFTSPAIARALVEAHKRGVKVEVILDRSRTEIDNEQAEVIVQNDVPTFIDDKHTTAHSKVVIIDGQVVITGSFNFTDQAEEENVENLLVIRDKALAEKFSGNWQAHVKHSGRDGKR